MHDAPDAAAQAKSTDTQGLHTRLGEARARELLLERRLAEVEAELAAVYRSRSWRLTAPIRIASARIGRLAFLKRLQFPLLPARNSAADLSKMKEAVRARAEAELNAFLDGSERLRLPNAAAPRISILLVLFNQAELTLACLRTIASEVQMPAEVVIVDNASSDRTVTVLDRLDGARIVRNSENRHFVNAVNQAARLAQGEALLLLNNDACLREGTLDAAWSTLSAHLDAGAVGGPIVLPDGTLQEAGSIIWSDGTCLGYGRGRDPGAPEFQFVREVDYCSGAFLLVRRRAFEELGGLDPAFAPAYYEETDLCMRLRRAGWGVLYDPRAVVDHFEFASATSSTGALELQRQHHGVFFDRHRAALTANHAMPGTSALSARMRGSFRGRVLVIEDRVPFPSLGAGYPRSARILHELVAGGWFVTLYPLLFAQDDWDEIRAKFPATIEVMLGYGESGLRRLLRERQNYYDAIMVCRPHNMRSFLNACGQKLPEARLIYDAEAIFAVRDLERLTLSGATLSPARKRALLDQELQLARAASTVVAVSRTDSELFRNFGYRDVRVVGHALTPDPTPPVHAARADLLFVGALDDDPSPNTDSLLWFASEVMPQLDALIGTEYRLLVAGRCGAERIARLAGPRIQLLGRVEDLSPLYACARLFIAPTRFAAGIPHKVHEAASRGLPVVARSLLARQLGWEAGRELLTGDTPQAFATACARLYRDPASWHQVRNAALARVAADCDADIFAREVQHIMEPGASAPAQAVQLADRGVVAPLRRFRLPGVGRHGWAALRYLSAHGLAATAQRLATELRKRFGRHDYATWLRLYDTLTSADRKAIAAHINLLVNRPIFTLTVLVDPNVPPDALRATLDSVLAQIYPDWELFVAQIGEDQNNKELLNDYAARNARVRIVETDAGTTQAAAANAAVSLANGRFIVAIEVGDKLRPHTLYMLAVECDADPEVALIYADHDSDDGGQKGRRDPKFKPDWSPELLSGYDGVEGVVAVRRSSVVSAGGYREGFDGLMEYDLLLRIAEAIDPAAIRHVPRILSHRGSATASVPDDLLRRVQAEHLARLGEAADIHVCHGVVRIVYHVPDPPLASVVVPTRDQAELLHRCVTGVLSETNYPRVEIIIVDNDSQESATHGLLRELATDARVRVLPFPHSFNYAAMNNQAVAQARGEVVALLNNDVAVRDADWLREMVSHALRPGVGAVGAKLYYADGTIQHAGVVTGMLGIAGHPFRHVDGRLDGPQGRLKRVQAVSCVTAACLVLRRAVYNELGGFDEVNLPVSYNDVDFCLRLRARGYRIVWTPHAELDHLESVTRGRDTKPGNVERAQREFRYMQRRWGAALTRDPFYSPNLTLSAEDGALAFPPRIAWPWRTMIRPSATTDRLGRTSKG